MNAEQPPRPNSYEWRDLRDSIKELTTEMRGLRGEMADTYVRKDVLEPQLETMNLKIEKHASNWDWLVKTVGAIIILGVLGLLIYSGAHH